MTSLAADLWLSFSCDSGCSVEAVVTSGTEVVCRSRRPRSMIHHPLPVKRSTSEGLAELEGVCLAHAPLNACKLTNDRSVWALSPGVCPGSMRARTVAITVEPCRYINTRVTLFI